MELRVEPVTIPEKFSFNYEQLKQEIEEKVSFYGTVIYTNDQIKTAKADRADLNRLKKALNDERIRREKEYMRPFNIFKAQINEIIGIIDKPVALIDKQIKEYEECQKRDKEKKIEEYFSSCSYVDLPWLKMSMIFDTKWLNASVSMKSIQEQIDARIEDINNDLAALSTLPEFAFEAVETYKTTLDLNRSIAEGHRLSEMQKRKAEQERLRAEQEKARAEQERQRQEREAAEKAERSSVFVSEEEVVESREAYEEAANVGGVHMPAAPWEVQNPVPEKQWVSFSALLDVEDARALAEFFKSRNIVFKKI